MEDVGSEVYTVQRVDGPGTGVRLVDANDTLYELRDLGGAQAGLLDGVQARIYGDEDTGFTAKIRKPVESDDLAFSEMGLLASAIEDEYDVDIQPDVEAFYDRVLERGACHTRRSGQHTLRYNPEPRVDSLPSTDPDEDWANLATLASVVGFGGAGIGGALGAIPELGIAVGIGGLGYTMWELAGFDGKVPSPAVSLTRRYKRRKLEEHKAGEHLTADLIQELNGLTLQKNAVEDKLYTDTGYEDLEDVERKKALEQDRRAILDDATWDRFQQQLDINFTDFHELDGITATYECGSYAGAANFVSTVTGRTVSAERPSLYTDPDLFSDIMELLPEDDQVTVLRNILTAGAADEVKAVAEEYDDLLQAAGREAALHDTDTDEDAFELTYDTLDAVSEDEAIAFIADDMGFSHGEAKKVYRRFVAGGGGKA